jgi:hypothetical protein
LFDLGIDASCGCDVVKIKNRQLVVGPEIRTRAIVLQQKTGRPVQFELMAGIGLACLLGSIGEVER